MVSKHKNSHNFLHCDWMRDKPSSRALWASHCAALTIDLRKHCFLLRAAQHHAPSPATVPHNISPSPMARNPLINNFMRLEHPQSQQRWVFLNGFSSPEYAIKLLLKHQRAKLNASWSIKPSVVFHFLISFLERKWAINGLSKHLWGHEWGQ